MIQPLTDDTMHQCRVRYLPIFPADPYARAIESFMGQEFPQLSNGRVEDRMEAVMLEFLGSKQTRVGPRPNPESEVKMRAVVRNAIEAGAPIPILIAAASVKVPIGESMDVAELSALRMLGSLNERITKHYAPGTTIKIRLEDLTESVISRDVPNIEDHVGQYRSDFKALVRVLGYDSFLAPVAESDMANRREFIDKSFWYGDIFRRYLDQTDVIPDNPLGLTSEGRLLQAAGWKGPVSRAMRDYLRSRYVKLYPTLDDSKFNGIMGNYLACILVRRSMNAMGMTGDRLEIGFSPAMPDAPTINTRVLYRTVPLSQSSLHIPFWNAKGFIKINEAGETRISLGQWNGEYVRGQLELINGSEQVTIRADYILE
jgi:hypothetical protein